MLRGTGKFAGALVTPSKQLGSRSLALASSARWTWESRTSLVANSRTRRRGLGSVAASRIDADRVRRWRLAW